MDHGSRVDPIIGEPTQQHSLSQHPAPEQPGNPRAEAAPPTAGPLTIAEYLDDLLVRIENWRPSGRPLVALVCLGAAAAAAGSVVLFLPRSESAPVDQLIPVVAEADATESGRAEGGTDGTGTGDGPDDSSDAAGEVDRSSDSSAVPEPTEIVVHVAGAVQRPGLVTLAPDSRIRDAIDRAGGPNDDADVHRLNLAAPAVDGMQVRVPTVDEDLPPGDLVELPASTPSAEAEAGGSRLINVNQATSEELQTLPGIGPALASAIITRREEHGPFGSVEELDGVPGIGPAKLATIRDLVTT